MEQFKLTLALNRGIDRSDEMAQGFTLPLLHPFAPILPPFLPLNHSTGSFSTAEFHLYVNEAKGAILKHPTRTLSSSDASPFCSNITRPRFMENTDITVGELSPRCRVSHLPSIVLSTMWMEVTVWRLRSQSHAIPYNPTVTLLTLELRGSGVVGLLTTALFDGTRLFTYSKGKWETHAELGEMWEGGRRNTKCCILVVSQECLRLAHFGQSSSDSSLVLLVRPKTPKWIFGVAPRAKQRLSFTKNTQKWKPVI